MTGRIGGGGFGELCNSEVEHFHISVGPEHDVLRFDVAMDNSGFMGGRQRTGHLNRYIDGLAHLHVFTLETLTHCLAFDQFAGTLTRDPASSWSWLALQRSMRGTIEPARRR